jgi:hypothetical protein
MSFCVHCGMRLAEGEAHACQQAAAGLSTGDHNGEKGASRPPQSGNYQSALAAVNQIDRNLVVDLVRNPLKALQLQPAKDLVYGLLGFAASLVGFILWAWMFGKKLDSMLNGIFGVSSDFGDWFETPSVSSAIIGRLIATGILSIISLLAAVWAINAWQGERKVTIKELTTHLGAAQYVFGAGFIVAGICGFISLRIAALVMAINLMTALVTNLVLVMDLSQTRQERKVMFIALSLAAYLIVFGVLTALFL